MKKASDFIKSVYKNKAQYLLKLNNIKHENFKFNIAIDETIYELTNIDIDSESILYENPQVNLLGILTAVLLHKNGYESSLDK